MRKPSLFGSRLPASHHLTVTRAAHRPNVYLPLFKFFFVCNTCHTDHQTNLEVLETFCELMRQKLKLLGGVHIVSSGIKLLFVKGTSSTNQT